MKVKLIDLLRPFLHSKWSLELSRHYPQYELVFMLFAGAINYLTYGLAILVFWDYISARNFLNAKLLSELNTPSLANISAGIAGAAVIAEEEQQKPGFLDKASYYINMQFIKNWKLRVAQWIVRDIAILVFFVWLAFFARITLYASAHSNYFNGYTWNNKTVNGSVIFR